MIGEMVRVADHFGGALWKRGRGAWVPKRGSGPQPLVVGTVLRNRYKVERFLFWDGKYNHYVATTLQGKGTYELREFPDHHGIEGEREIMAKQVCHRGILRRHDLFIEGNRSYVVLEYYEVPDLENSRRVFSARDILRIAFNVADTVGYLHRHGVAKVDLSSGNIRSMGGIQKIVDLSACRLFATPFLEGFREARKRDFLGLVDLLERLILQVVEESEDPSLLPLIRGLEDMVERPPLSAEEFKERLSQYSATEAGGEDSGGLSDEGARDRNIQPLFPPGVP
jgi:serine/threonine protein kinase